MDQNIYQLAQLITNENAHADAKFARCCLLLHTAILHLDNVSDLSDEERMLHDPTELKSAMQSAEARRTGHPAARLYRKFLVTCKNDQEKVIERCKDDLKRIKREKFYKRLFA